MASSERAPAQQPGASAGTAAALEAARAFGVMLGGPVVLAAAVGAGAIAVARALAAGRLPRPLALAGVAVTAVYALEIRPWILRWGATQEELEEPLPGDELVPDPGIVSTRAVAIDAPAAVVWQWLAQIGQDRGGFYSYEWLENLAGCRMRNADRIHPEWQQREVGEIVLLHPLNGLRLARFEPGRVLALEGWGAFVVEPIDEKHTRLLARGRTKRGLGPAAMQLLLEIPHFLMERKMLLGIKARAERAAGSGRAQE